MLTKEEREAKLRRAQALRRKAASTTSEAEAMACISQVRRMQAEAGLTLEEIEADGEAVSPEHFRKETMYSSDGCWNHVDNNLAFDIAKFCRVKVGTVYPLVNNVREYHLEFFGYEADVDNAVWLRANIRDAMLHGWLVHQKFVVKPGENQANARMWFSAGMAKRLRERMQAVADEDTEAEVSCALVLADKVAQRAREVGFVEAQGSARRRTNVFNASAFASGMAEGNRVNLGRGVENRASSVSNTPRMIGK